MRTRRSLVLAMLLVAQTGCHSYAYRLPKPETPLPPPPPSLPPAAPSPEQGGGGICEIDPAACPKPGDLERRSPVRAEVYAVQQSFSSDSALGSLRLSSPAAPPSTTLPEAAPEGAPHEMLDVEARFSIECDTVAVAAAKLRETVRARGGSITLDESTSGGSDPVTTFEVRVPVGDFDALLVHLASLGTIDAREVKVKDIGKEHHDAELLLHDLEVASKRYEQLLARATAVADVLSIEHELERLRNSIDHTKGNLAWMKDRVARATVRIRLHPSQASTGDDPPLASKSRFFPGLRAVSLVDLRGESDRYGYVGGGVTFAYHGGRDGPRAIVLELDMARTALTDRPPDSNYAYLGLGGVDLYSDLLGGGRRRFLNPYLGFRGGYAQSEGHGDLALGGVLGLDVFKSQRAIVDLALRTLALVGNEHGAHVVLGPTLGLDFAF